jgi:hypothetical protein
MNADTRTHENEYPVSVLLPAVDHLVVLFLCDLGVHGEERPRAVTKVGFSLRWRIRCRRRAVGVAIWYRHHEISEERSNLPVAHTRVVPHIDDLMSSLRH